MFGVEDKLVLAAGESCLGEGEGLELGEDECVDEGVVDFLEVEKFGLVLLENEGDLVFDFKVEVFELTDADARASP